MARRRGIKTARHQQVLGHQPVLAGFKHLGQFILRDRVIGGGGGFQQGQGAFGIGRTGLALEQHVGQVGLCGRQTGLGRQAVNLFGLFGILGRALAPAQHHRHSAQGGQVFVLDRRPDLECLCVVMGVIGGHAGVEHGGQLLAGLCAGAAACRQGQAKGSGSQAAAGMYRNHASS
jgi:hypothetical protein